MTDRAGNVERRRLGFIGLGRMGLQMAKRLARAGNEIRVWNRSAGPVDEARSAGATSVASIAELFETTDLILMSLANEEATDSVLGRVGDRLAFPATNRTLMQLGTTSPAYSRSLAQSMAANGGGFIEAPVSGSKRPAEDGTLIGLIGALCESDYQLAEAVLAPLTAYIYRCGQPGDAMTMKLAINSYLIAMVMGLAESWAFADRLGLDLTVFREVLDAGPMASAVSRIKLEKLANDDMSSQASIADVRMNARLVAGLAREAGFPLMLGERCESLLTIAEAQGLAGEDMIAVAKIMGSSK